MKDGNKGNLLTVNPQRKKIKERNSIFFLKLAARFKALDSKHLLSYFREYWNSLKDPFSSWIEWKYYQ